MEAISALLNAPIKVIRPATIHTLVRSNGEPNCEAIKAGFINIPEPITLPITIEIAAFSPSVRFSSFISSLVLSQVELLHKRCYERMKMMGALLSFYRIASMRIKPGTNTFLYMLYYLFILQFYGVQATASTKVKL